MGFEFLRANDRDLLVAARLPARLRPASVAVLLCNPFGEEAVRAHRAYRVLAQRLVRKIDATEPSGYKGRTGVFELLVVNDAIRSQIHSQSSEAEVRAAALANGMTLMRDDGERLIAQGVTSREEVLRVTRD